MAAIVTVIKIPEIICYFPISLGCRRSVLSTNEALHNGAAERPQTLQDCQGCRRNQDGGTQCLVKASGRGVYTGMQTPTESKEPLFSDLNLSEPIQRAVRDTGYTVPTPIQIAAIPHLLAGRDLLGCAQTGTG